MRSDRASDGLACRWLCLGNRAGRKNINYAVIVCIPTNEKMHIQGGIERQDLPRRTLDTGAADTDGSDTAFGTTPG